MKMATAFFCSVMVYGQPRIREAQPSAPAASTSTAAQVSAALTYSLRFMVFTSSDSKIIENGANGLSEQIAANGYITVFSTTLDGFPEVSAELVQGFG